jgi:hypothetical protein
MGVACGSELRVSALPGQVSASPSRVPKQSRAEARGRDDHFH